MLRYCETKQFRGKNVTADPSLILNKLRYPKIIKHWKINIRNVSELSDKKFDRKSWYPPVLSSNSLTTGKCLIHSTEGFLYDLLRYCETKQVRRTIVTTAPLSSYTILDTINFLRHTRFPPQKFSALWDKKFSTESLDTRPPPSLSINFFTSENFLKHSREGLLYEIIRNSETKQFWWKNMITAPSLILYIFRYQKFSETKKGSLTKIFGTVRRKKSDRNYS